MDVNQNYCQSCHLISRNGFIIRKIMSSVNTNILVRFRLKFLRITRSTPCYKERVNFENTLYNGQGHLANDERV
jgi:hypothetical protein